jgi:hypothetical protein
MQTKSSEENSNRCTKYKWQEHHKDAKIPHSQVPTKLLKLLGNKRGRIKERHKIPQNLDPQRYTHKEMFWFGQNVDLDLLQQPLKYMQESMEGCVEIKLKE